MSTAYYSYAIEVIGSNQCESLLEQIATLSEVFTYDKESGLEDSGGGSEWKEMEDVMKAFSAEHPGVFFVVSEDVDALYDGYEFPTHYCFFEGRCSTAPEESFRFPPACSLFQECDRECISDQYLASGEIHIAGIQDNVTILPHIDAEGYLYLRGSTDRSECEEDVPIIKTHIQVRGIGGNK